MRLNGWQRIGIVASVVWALGTGYYQRNEDVKSATALANLAYALCDYDNSHLGDKRDCSLDFKQSFDLQIEGSWANVAMVSFVPIPLAWLAVYLAIRIWRWVRAGFKKA